MFHCNKCNAEFKYESELRRHINRKIPCVSEKVNHKCDICGINFLCHAEKNRHERTNKHKNNVINSTLNADSIHIGDNINSFNNIINLTLNVNSFKNTDMTFIGKHYLYNVGEYVRIEIFENKHLCEIDKILLVFDEIIRLLEKLHFNIAIEENHNLKILLIFPGIKKKLYEYLILEINPETKKILWNSLKFEDLIKNIIDNLIILNVVSGANSENYLNVLNYLKINLLENENNLKELKPKIDKKLSEMYINFNKNQNKEEREEKDNIYSKVHEYITYRKNECKLNNGYNPEIINTEFK